VGLIFFARTEKLSIGFIFAASVFNFIPATTSFLTTVFGDNVLHEKYEADGAQQYYDDYDVVRSSLFDTSLLEKTYS
jgi:hypothetical protein